MAVDFAKKDPRNNSVTASDSMKILRNIENWGLKSATAFKVFNLHTRPVEELGQDSQALYWRRCATT